LTKATIEERANAYMRLYNFLRFKHPEILEEFRTLMKEAKDKEAGIFNASMEK
jgi:hypothetical protein